MILLPCLFHLTLAFPLLHKLFANSTYELCNVDHETLPSALTVIEASSSFPWLSPVPSLRRGLAQWVLGAPSCLEVAFT